jgi:antitoxin component YwqK of YwqJK toxin-antitoxin module
MQFQGTYKNGGKDGPWVKYNTNGRISTEVTYSDGKWKEGTRVTYSYYGNRQLKSKGTHKDGKRVGTWVRYWENGRLHYNGTYNKDGEMHGPWVTYTKDETVIEKYTGTFKNDKKISD